LTVFSVKANDQWPRFLHPRTPSETWYSSGDLCADVDATRREQHVAVQRNFGHRLCTGREVQGADAAGKQQAHAAASVDGVHAVDRSLWRDTFGLHPNPSRDRRGHFHFSARACLLGSARCHETHHAIEKGCVCSRRPFAFEKTPGNIADEQRKNDLRQSACRHIGPH
jgi:hypothetical protein